MRKFSFMLLVMALTVALSGWAFSADDAKWTPQYGEKGELLNPEPSVQLYRTTSGNGDTPIITANVLTEDFESAWSTGSPPSGWTINDYGTEGSQAWWTDDPMNYYYSSWSDTVCRVLYYSNSVEDNYDEWVITPTIDFSSATACSVYWKEYYYNGSTTNDSAMILGSTDDGATWTQTIVVYHSSQGSYSSPNRTGYNLSWAVGESQVKIAFRQLAYGSSVPYYWYIDSVTAVADGSPLWVEDFNNWGPYGDNPPAGWTMLDNGTPKAAQGTWNNNDWYKYTAWSSGTARCYYTSSYREWNNDWLISPTFSLSSGALCSLKVVEYFYYYSSADAHCYILLSSDGGSTWPDTIAHHYGSSLGSSSSKTTFAYDISSHSGESNLAIAFQYTNSPYGYAYWQLDDFLVEEFVMLSDDIVKVAINAPTLAIEGYNWDIKTTVANLGINTANFDDSTYIEQIVKTQHFFEDFNSDWGPYGDNPPTGWTINDYGDEATPTWNCNDWHRYSYWSGYVAAVRYSPVENQDEWLISPAVDLSTISQNIYMTFRAYYNDYSGDEDTAYILGSADDFVTIDTLAAWTVDHLTENPVWDITSWAANQSNVKVAFRYRSYDQGNWYVDDVEIFSLYYPAAEYVRGENIVGLVSLDDTLITYSTTWSPSAASDYIITSFTAMAADLDNSNDTLISQITCYPHVGSFGPDGGYYSWEDNITGTGGAYNWYDISGSGTTVTWDAGSSDDRYTYGIPLGFSFLFYGNNFTRLYLSENGVATFDSLTTSYSGNADIPISSAPNNVLAFLWDDLNGTAGTAYYQTVDYDSDSDDEFIVQFDNWGYYSSSLTSTMQAQFILDPTDNSIIYQYNAHGPDISQSMTIGIENSLGDIGLRYLYNGDPFGNMALPGLAITFTYNPPPIDGALTSIDIPGDGAYLHLGETITPTVTISALGEDPVTPDVTVEIYDESASLVYSETETAPEIPGLSSAQYAFTVDFTTASEGTHDVVAYVVVSGDVNHGNDTLTTDFEVDEHFQRGGPDDYGYRYVDNISYTTALDLPAPPTFNWIDVSATGDTLGTGSGNSGYSNPVTLGFSFDFYGTAYTDFYVIGYGYITFGNYYSYSSNYCLPYMNSSYDDPTICAFWDYGYPSSSYDGYVIGQYFDDVVDYYVIQYQNFRRSSQNLNFEIILYEDGNILVQYLDVYEGDSYGVGQSATVGVQSEYSLSPARAGLNYECNGDPQGNLLRDSLAVMFYFYQPAIDPIMVSLDAPVVGDVGVSTAPVYTVKNNGASATAIDIDIVITDATGDTVFHEVETTPSIDPGVTQQITFSRSWNPGASGSYTGIATCDVTGDEFPENNTATLGIAVYDDIVNFEADDGGLDATNEWEWGTPTGYGPGGAHSGVNCWGTVLDGEPPYGTAAISDLDFMLDVTPARGSFTTATLLTEGFENGGAIPSGWTDSPGSYPWLYDDGTSYGPGSPHGGSYAAYYDNYVYSAGTTDTLISPSMDFSAYSGNYTLRYWGWFNSGTDSMVVYLNENGSLTRLHLMPTSSSWVQYSVNFSSSSTNGKIYFIGYSDYGSYNTYIDDVVVEEQPTQIAKFGFYEWYKGSSSSYYYRVFVDSGAGYQLISERQGSDDTWHPYLIDMSAYTGIVKMRLQFEHGTYTSTSYPGWYVDDFLFENCELFFYTNEVQVVSIDAPANPLEGGETYDVVATVRNNSIVPLTFDVYAWDDGVYSPSAQTVTALGPDSTTQVTFTGWAATGCLAYELTVATALPADEEPSNDTLTADYVVLNPYNIKGQYDDGIMYNATRFVGEEPVMAVQFDVPFTSVDLIGIEYEFSWEGESDSVEVFLYRDSDGDGIPDIIPAYADTLVTVEGLTEWLVDCDTDFLLNCETFWAGWSLIDTIVAANEAWIGLDEFDDYEVGWVLSSGVWGSFNSSYGGEIMIRAYYNNLDSTTAPIAELTPASVTGGADVGGSDSDNGTLSNTNTIGCDLEYDVAITYDYGAVAGTQVRGEPTFWVPVNDKTPEEISPNGDKPMEPVYPPLTMGAGGPDAGGYTWIDSDETGGPTYSWIDISTLGTEINWPRTGTEDTLDDKTVEVAMGMTFNFYGVNYTDATISTNGFISFLSLSSSYPSDASIPSSSDPNAVVAAFWDDLEGENPTSTFGHAYYYYDATENQFIVSWVNWHHYGSTGVGSDLTFQIILDGDDATIKYQYGTMTATQTDYTVGIENASGTIGLEVTNDRSYVQSNMAVLFNPPVMWLSTDLVDSVLSAGDSRAFNIYMDATELACGTYNGAVVVSSNDPDNPSAQVDVEFVVGATITGTVTDVDDAVIEGVLVRLYDSTPALLDSITTDINGEYSFICLDGDTYALEFVKAGYFDAASEPVALASGTTEVVDIVMHRPASYAGKVTDYYTTPLPDVHVYATAPAAMLSTEALQGTMDQSEGMQVVETADIINTLKGNDATMTLGAADKGMRQITAIDISKDKMPTISRPVTEAEYCEIIMTGDPYWAVPDWFSGQEMYALYMDPAICGISPTYPFMVTDITFSIQNSGAAQYFYYAPVIFDADLTNPTCPVPGATLFVGAVDSLLFPTGHYIIGSSINYVVNGPFFMGFIFPNAQTGFALVTDNSSVPGPVPSCIWYNEYGSGWVDMAGPFASAGLASNFWRSYGYSTAAPIFIADTYTDVNGDYELLLDQGTYDIHYDTTGWDSQVASAVTLTIDQVVVADVVLRRPGSLSGNVISDEGDSLENVHVTVDDGSRAIIAEGYTDVNGDYSIPDIYDGDYTITFSLEDYDTVTVTAYHINDGQAAVMDQVMELSGFAYFPGDANMRIQGSWPPAVTGAEVTVLISYFRGLNLEPACPLAGTGFWMSADANGDCEIRSSDATRLINYLRGIFPEPPEPPIKYCPDYMPLWLTTDDFPTTAPDGWPNCDPVILNAKVIPTINSPK